MPATPTAPAPSASAAPVDFSGSSVVAPPTDGVLEVDFDLQVQGAAPSRLPAIAVWSNEAELVVGDRTHTGVAYQSHPDFDGYDVFDVLSIAADGSSLSLTWLYCRYEGLIWAWNVDFQHPMTATKATGSCRSSPTTVQTHVRLPPLLATPPPRPTGLEITGKHIHFADTAGTLVLSGRTYDLQAFALVDCETCPRGPWLEIHGLLRGQGEAGFGILYLYPEEHPEKPGQVRLTNTLILPTLWRPDVLYEATWSGSPVNATAGTILVEGEPPTVLARPAPAPLGSR